MDREQQPDALKSAPDDDLPIVKPVQSVWRQAASWVQGVAPEVVVNENARISFGMRIVANALGVMSGLRPGTLNDISLHAPYFQQHPQALPKGQTQYVKGMKRGQYNSPRRAIAGGISLTALALGAYFGERPQTKEERAAYQDMAWRDYVPLRISHAFRPDKHAVATVGMADLANGLVTVGAGLPQLRGFLRTRSREHIPFETLKGTLSILAGGLMWFHPDQEKAWQLSQSVMLGRSPLSAGLSWQAWRTGIPGSADAGDWTMPTKFVLNHASNFFGALFAGIEKEDGVITRIEDRHLKEESLPDLLISSTQRDDTLTPPQAVAKAAA